MDIPCLSDSGVIPANPDISGIGIRVAIYIQNLLSFIPAFYALKDKKISKTELRTIEKQATTILITAFAVLISAMVQASTFGLYSFHTLIILDLSWMNNTNTFIYFLLYVQHKKDAKGLERVDANWSSWYNYLFRSRRSSKWKADVEATSVDPEARLVDKVSDIQPEPDGKHNIVSVLLRGIRCMWRTSKTGIQFIRKNFVLVLGSGHLTVMAAYGLWFWSSPYRYENIQNTREHPPLDPLPYLCTSTTIVGANVSVTSTVLKRASLIIYSIFLLPGSNLIIPSLLFLLLFMLFAKPPYNDAENTDARETADSAREASPSEGTAGFHPAWRIRHLVHEMAYFPQGIVPVLSGLSFLLAVNVVFIYDIETAIRRAAPYQAGGESQWTFGQTLAVLLLVLPIRDVYDYIRESLVEDSARASTQDLKNALKNKNNPDWSKALRAARNAHDVRVYLNEEFPSALQFAAYHGRIDLVRALLERKANINVDGGRHGTPLMSAASQGHEQVAVFLVEYDAEMAVLGLADRDGLTALHHALLHGMHTLVEELLKRGASTSSRAHNGHTPFHIAVMKTIEPDGGFGAGLELLLRDGHINIDEEDSDGRTSLVYAVCKGHTLVAQLLLDYGAQLEQAGSDGWTPLIHASHFGHDHIVSLLLARGAIIDQTDAKGWTPLIHAAQSGFPAVARCLLASGANVNLADNGAWTPLMHAARCESNGLSIIKLLLSNDADVYYTDNLGRSVLHHAAESGYELIAPLLLEWANQVHGLERPDTDQHTTSLQIAARNGHWAFIKALLQVDPRAKDHLSHGDQAGCTPLIDAAKNGHEQVVRILLDQETNNVNQAQNDGRTALIMAAQFGQVSLVRLLLERGADVNQASRGGSTPIIIASQHGHELIVEILLKHGADGTWIDNHHLTSLIVASRNGCQSVVQVLLAHGLDPNQATLDGTTPLVMAAENGHWAVVHTLLEYRANINQAMSDGYTPLMQAARHGHDSIVQLLLEHGAEPNHAYNRDWTSLLSASLYGHERVVQLLLDHGASISHADMDGWTSLLLAASKGHESVTRLLLNCNANLEQTNNHGRTSLLLTSSNGHESAARLLLDRGANLEQADDQDWTSLLLASSKGHESVAQLLLDRGASISHADTEGWTSLLLASANGHDSIVQLLLGRGANLEQATNAGWTSLLLASANGHESVVRVVLDFGAALQHTNIRGSTALFMAVANGQLAIIALLLERGVGIREVDDAGRTVLHIAAMHGHVQVAQLLLDQDADLNQIDQAGETASHLAARHGHEPTLRLFIDKGIELSQQDHGGWTALHGAASGGHEPIVRLLLDQGAEVDQASNSGMTALTWACCGGYDALARMLLDRGASLNHQTRDGVTGLLYAAGWSHNSVIQLLLERGADFELADNKGQTPWSLAIEQGKEEILRIIIDEAARRRVDIGGLGMLSTELASVGMQFKGLAREEPMLGLREAMREEDFDVNGLCLAYGAA